VSKDAPAADLIYPEFGVMRLYEIVTRTLFPLI